MNKSLLIAVTVTLGYCGVQTALWMKSDHGPDQFPWSSSWSPHQTSNHKQVQADSTNQATQDWYQDHMSVEWGTRYFKALNGTNNDRRDLALLRPLIGKRLELTVRRGSARRNRFTFRAGIAGQLRKGGDQGAVLVPLSAAWAAIGNFSP
jgi:hypothetical protein